VEGIHEGPVKLPLAPVSSIRGYDPGVGSPGLPAIGVAMTPSVTVGILESFFWSFFAVASLLRCETLRYVLQYLCLRAFVGIAGIVRDTFIKQTMYVKTCLH
jgi:hypothetical protein